MTLTLETALAAFARTRSSEITPTIIELGKHAAFKPPEARKNIDFHLAWLATVTDPAAITWALKTLTDQLPKLFEGKEHVSGDKSDALTERIEALVQLAPDPRISTALCALIEVNAPIIGFYDVMGAMLDALAKHADDATATDALAEFFDDREFKYKKRVFPKALKLGTADDVFRGKKRTPSADAAGLWRAVLESPDDDAPREVLSDYLQEQGDPRGEFIALQLREARGQASAPEIARAQELAKKHGKDWLGALRPISARVEMRRGFVWRLELDGSWSTKAWATLAHDPSLATVEELRRGKAVGKLIAPFITSGVMKSLRTISLAEKPVIEAVNETLPPKLDFVWHPDDRPEALAFVERHPQVTGIGLDWADSVSSLKKWSPALRNRVTRLICDYDIKNLKAIWALLPNLQELELTGQLSRTFRRGDDETVRVTSTSTSYGDLKGLPKSFKVVEMIGNAAHHKRLEQQHPRLKFVSKPSPSGLITNPKG